MNLEKTTQRLVVNSKQFVFDDSKYQPETSISATRTCRKLMQYSDLKVSSINNT